MARYPLLSVIFFLMGFCSCGKKQDKEVAIEVVTFSVAPKTIDIPLEFVGVTQSSHLVEIWARVEGYLDKIEYTEGAYVKAGDPLFQLDPKEYENLVTGAKANLEREKAGLWAAQKAVDRYKPLFEQKAASRKDLDDATAQLLAEQAAVNMFQAKVAEAELNLSYTTVLSPISGLTTSARYREGTLITPGTNGLLTTVSVIDPIWVSIAVSDYYFLISQQEIAKGELIVPPSYSFDVTLKLADGSQFPETGKVSFVSPVLDPDTGTLGVRAVFPNANSLLKPGQFVRVHAMGAQKPNAMFVPLKAVQQGAKGQFVYVVDQDSRAQMRLVEVGNWYGDIWVIKSGLQKGDEVIVEGVNKVRAGTLVKAKKAKK
jgi:membrane fusion protein (multidrug efflux system)